MIKYTLMKLLPDIVYLKYYYKKRMGKKLNLRYPTTFNEKLQYLKLYDRDPRYIKMVDKIEAKKYVAEIIGESYIIPTIGEWDNPEDISMESLPNEFVLKCTHDSGSVIICRDKNTFDMTKARQELRNSMSINYYWLGREWPYKNIKPRIMAEPFLHDDKEEELKDYKFFCFDGNMKALFIAQDRQKDGEETKFDFFDRDFNHLPIINGHPNAKTVPEKPQNYELMISLAEKLSKGIPQLRVDFYEVNEQVLFGELTFSHWSGFVPFEPPEWDAKFGEWITLPKKRKICDCLKD